MDRPLEIALGLVFALLIVALVLFARGEPGRGDPASSPTAAIVGQLA